MDGEGSCGHPVVIVTILSKASASTVEMLCICVPPLSSLIHSFNKYLLNPRRYSSTEYVSESKMSPFSLSPLVVEIDNKRVSTQYMPDDNKD